MKYVKESTKENVVKFEYKKENLIFSTLQSFLFEDYYLISKNVDRSSFWVFNSLLYFQDEMGDHFLYRDETDTKLLNVGFYTNNLRSDFILCYLNKKKINRKRIKDIGIFDTNEFSIKDIVLRETSLPVNWYDEKLIISVQDDTIQCISILKKDQVWSYNLIDLKGFKIDRKSSETNKIEVLNFLGVYKGVLWIVLNNGFLLGLKEDSGEEMYYIGIAENNDFEKELFQVFGHAYISDQYKLDYESGKIILLNGTSYFEIDLNAEKLKKTWKNMSETLGDIKCDMSGNNGFKFDNQFLYAYDGPKGEIIVIDRENLSLVWNYNLEIQTNDDFVLSLLRDLKVSSSQLGVLDRNQTLHIFQRENV